MSKIETIFLPIVADDNILSLTLNENKQFTLAKFDEFMADIDKLINLTVDYEYSEEDRKTIKSFKSATNKYAKAIDEAIKEQRKFLFDDVETKRKLIQIKLNELATALSRGLDEHDKRDKEEKLKYIESLFNKAKDAYEHLKDSELVLDNILRSQWLNRTATMASVIKDMNTRLEVLNSLYSSELLPTDNLKDILHALEIKEYNGLLALQYLIDQENKKQELARQILEKAASLEQSPKQDKITVQFSEDAWIKAKYLLDANNIKYIVG